MCIVIMKNVFFIYYFFKFIIFLKNYLEIKTSNILIFTFKQLNEFIIMISNYFINVILNNISFDEVRIENNKEETSNVFICE